MACGCPVHCHVHVYSQNPVCTGCKQGVSVDVVQDWVIKTMKTHLFTPQHIMQQCQACVRWALGEGTDNRAFEFIYKDMLVVFPV